NRENYYIKIHEWLIKLGLMNPICPFVNLHGSRCEIFIIMLTIPAMNSPQNLISDTLYAETLVYRIPSMRKHIGYPLCGNVYRIRSMQKRISDTIYAETYRIRSMQKRISDTIYAETCR
ncbi:hypothetical protein L9F63_001052, partial [Diploptera punctata]